MRQFASFPPCVEDPKQKHAFHRGIHRAEYRLIISKIFARGRYGLGMTQFEGLGKVVVGLVGLVRGRGTIWQGSRAARIILLIFS